MSILQTTNYVYNRLYTLTNKLKTCLNDNDIDKLSDILINYNIKNEKINGMYILIYYCYTQNPIIDIYRLLLNNGLKINVMDETYENNCLSAYCKNHSNMNVIRFLIENGAVINISVNNLALTLLQQPEFDNIELLEFIRNYNSSFFDSPCKLLESYIKCNNNPTVDMINYILYVNVNKRFSGKKYYFAIIVNYINECEYNFIKLYFMSQYNKYNNLNNININVINAFIQNGFNINVTDEYKLNTLMWLVKHYDIHLDIIKYFCENNINIYQTNILAENVLNIYINSNNNSKNPDVIEYFNKLGLNYEDNIYTIKNEKLYKNTITEPTTPSISAQTSLSPSVNVTNFPTPINSSPPSPSSKFFYKQSTIYPLHSFE